MPPANDESNLLHPTRPARTGRVLKRTKEIQGFAYQEQPGYKVRNQGDVPDITRPSCILVLSPELVSDSEARLNG